MLMMGETSNARTYTQQSEKPPMSEMRSSDRNFSRTHYQQLNYNESEQSFDRHRYSNYDSKNVTQQIPPLIMQNQHSKESSAKAIPD
jgi:hypothetical protein